MDTTGHLTETNLWLNRARHALKMGDAESSVSILKKLVERGYRNPAAYEIMSKAHLQLGHKNEAILAAIACTELCPQWYSTHLHTLFEIILNLVCRVDTYSDLMLQVKSILCFGFCSTVLWEQGCCQICVHSRPRA